MTRALQEFLSDGGDMQIVAILGACLIYLAMGLYQRWRGRN